MIRVCYNQVKLLLVNYSCLVQMQAWKRIYLFNYPILLGRFHLYAFEFYLRQEESYVLKTYSKTLFVKECKYIFFTVFLYHLDFFVFDVHFILTNLKLVNYLHLNLINYPGYYKVYY